MRSTVTWPLLRSFTREQQNCKSNKISKLQNHISDLQGCIHAACGEKVVHEVVQHLLMYHRVVNVGEQGRRARMAGSRSIFFRAHGDARGDRMGSFHHHLFHQNVNRGSHVSLTGGEALAPYAYQSGARSKSNERN